MACVQADDLARAVTEPNKRLSEAPDTDPLRRALEQMLQYLAVAQPVVEAVEAALQEHMHNNNAGPCSKT